VGTVRNDYQRLLVALGGTNAADDTLRMSRLIWQHLDAPSNVGANRRARSVRIAPIAIRERAELPAEIPQFEQADATEQPFARIHQLIVGPFRGLCGKKRST
jgi:hypothetical protein